MKNNKGSGFERTVCKLLSLWWSKGETDAIFWRTAGSGARATTRAKQGKKTYGSYGDIKAEDPIGEDLLKVFTFELKRGYNKFNNMDLLEKNLRKSSKQLYDKFIKSVIIDAQESGSLSWMLVVKKDRRDILAFFPFIIAKQLKIKCKEYIIQKILFKDDSTLKIYGCKLDEFCSAVSIEDIRKLL